MMIGMSSRKQLQVAVALAVASLPLAAFAQSSRLSLADRVTRLEQQAQQDQGSVGLVNQVQLLQGQLRDMQGQIERLQHDLDQLEERNRAQYLDLDSRLSQAGAAAPVDASVAPTTAADGDAVIAAEVGQQPVADVPPPAVVSASPEQVQADYDRAFSELRAGDFPAASRLFSAFIQQHPNSDLTSNANYWLGESYYATQNYPVALESFQNLLARFPDSSKAAGALLKVGYCQYELEQWDQARQTLNRVVSEYPGSTEARMAEGRLRALELNANR